MQVLGLLIGYPLLALVPALLCLGLGAWGPSRVASLAGVLWLAYAGYEYLMKARVLCSGECNIRVDLLLIYPVLAAVSLYALVHTARARRRSG